MQTRILLLSVVGLLAFLIGGGTVARDFQRSPGKFVGADTPEKEDPKREADREAIRQTSRDFAKAFARGDAKAAASFWTAQGEYEDESGERLRGRQAIEQAFSDFFKAKPNSQVEIQIESIRFLSADSAIEDGLLRQTSNGKELPTSTLYSVVHVREGGQWKMAQAREWGSGKDRLEDLDWLLGTWQGTLKDQELTLSFTRDKNKPFLVGHFTNKTKGKTVSAGNMKIGFDAQRGQLRSWHFDDDGGHGQSLWVRDGNRWVLDASGVLTAGTETASVNILTRLNANEVTWRSVDRVVGDDPLPDTIPIKLTRVPTPTK